LVQPDSGVSVWVDLVAPTPEEGRILSDVFHFHELSVEDALSDLHHPKLEMYEGYLYLILHGIDFEASQHRFATHDTDFFLGPNYLVTVHDGSRRSIEAVRGQCTRNQQILGEGPAALLHRIVDSMVDHYRPEVDKLEERIDELEEQVFESPGPQILKTLLDLKRDVASLRRVTLPQRDALGRLGRREFDLIDEKVAYRFRDVYDHLVRLADQATALQDRITSLLEAHLSNVSNQLNGVMKVLTIISTIFMPLTVLTGMYGMNVDLPHLPGGEAAQFWWIGGVMLLVCLAMLGFFRKKGWL
jgi:magnesium transporter